MLKLLLKVRLMAWLAYLGGTAGTRGKKKPGKGKALLFGILYLYLIAVFLFMFYAMFSSMAEVFHSMGLGWFYFAMFAMLSFAMMFVFSVFTAKAQLFEAKDNELLLSMPVAPSTILASRMISLLLLNFGFELIVAVPAAIAWCMSCPVTVMGAAAFIVECLCLPFFSLAISALFGWLLAVVTARVRRKSLVSTIMSMAFLAAYFYVYSQINTILNTLVTQTADIARSVSAALPVYWLGAAVANGKVIDLALGAACLLLPFALVYVMLSRTFIKTATTRRGFARTRYVERSARVASPFAALVRREGMRLLSSSTYIMNAAMGALMSLIMAGVLVVKGADLLAVLDMLPADYLAPIMTAALCMVSAMTTISSCAVSLEGKNLWIVKSMPVATADVLKAKLALHLLVSAPSTFLVQIAFCIVFRPDGLGIAMMLVIPQLFGLAMALIGLWANLRHPKLDWQSEAQAVKQGMSVAIAMFSGWGLVLLPVIAAIFLAKSAMGVNIVAAVFFAALAALSALLYRWCTHCGSEIFESL